MKIGIQKVTTPAAPAPGAATTVAPASSIVPTPAQVTTYQLDGLTMQLGDGSLPTPTTRDAARAETPAAMPAQLAKSRETVARTPVIHSPLLSQAERDAADRAPYAAATATPMPSPAVVEADEVPRTPIIVSELLLAERAEAARAKR